MGTVQNQRRHAVGAPMSRYQILTHIHHCFERQGIMSQTTILLWTAIAEAVWLAPVGLYYQYNRDTMTVRRKRILLTTATIIFLAIMTIAAVISLCQ